MCLPKYVPREQDLIALTKTIVSGKDPQAVGSALGMSPRTVRRRTLQIMQNNQNCPQIANRGGPHHCIVTPDMEEFMIQFLEDNSSATLEEIKRALLDQFNIPNDKISLSTIHNHLDGNFISYKKLRYISANANTPEVIQERVNYLNQLTSLPENVQQIYIDEANFTIFTRRNMGRSIRGSRAVQAALINGCRKINIIAAVSPNYGWVYHETETDNVDAIRFEVYFKNLIIELKNKYPDQKFVFIMDNYSIHRKHELLQLCQAANFLLLFLPPYSPYLNPIERCFSQIKANIKKYLQQKNQLLIDTIKLPFGRKGVIRFQVLTEALDYAIQTVTNANIQNYLNYSHKFYPMIFQMQPIFIE